MWGPSHEPNMVKLTHYVTLWVNIVTKLVYIAFSDYRQKLQ